MVPGLSEVALVFVVILGLAVFTGLGAGLLIRVRRGVRRLDPLPPRRAPDPSSSMDEGDVTEPTTSGDHPRR